MNKLFSVSENQSDLVGRLIIKVFVLQARGMRQQMVKTDGGLVTGNLSEVFRYWIGRLQFSFFLKLHDGYGGEDLGNRSNVKDRFRSIWDLSLFVGPTVTVTEKNLTILHSQHGARESQARNFLKIIREGRLDIFSGTIFCYWRDRDRLGMRGFHVGQRNDHQHCTNHGGYEVHVSLLAQMKLSLLEEKKRFGSGLTFGR